MLELAEVRAGYGAVEVLTGMSFAVASGEVICLMGRNGAGKTTTLRAIMGQVRVGAGQIRLAGQRLDGLPAHRIAGQGVGYVPQGRRLWGGLTVAENLAVGLMARGRGDVVRERVLGLFPRLRERLDQPARTLSGGEQQMLAIGRALCLEPRVLLLDEPTEGLQPSMIALIGDTVRALRGMGVAVVLVEQRVDAAIRLADRVGFVQGGRIAALVEAARLTPASAEVAAYVGV
ncbi:MAG: ABC transporter ATP-binding protein [Pseudomonadota bacterium]